MKEKKSWQKNKLNLPFLIPLDSAPPTLGNAWCCKNCDLIFLYTGDDNANGKDRCLCKFRCLSKLFQLPAQIEEDTVSGDVVKLEGDQPLQEESKIQEMLNLLLGKARELCSEVGHELLQEEEALPHGEGLEGGAGVQGPVQLPHHRLVPHQPQPGQVQVPQLLTNSGKHNDYQVAKPEVPEEQEPVV